MPENTQNPTQNPTQDTTQSPAQDPAHKPTAQDTQPQTAPHGKSTGIADLPDLSPEVKQRNKPSGTHYVEPSPLGIEPVEQTGVDKETNPPRRDEHPAQTAEVPLGTGTHDEPAGGGGRESQRQR